MSTPTSKMYSQNEKIEKINVAEEMSQSFLAYSMSVIVSRALPDARDGLKPSQRRILFAMNELGVSPSRKHLKCAKIVGETMGNYHPHGDQAIYPTLVHMAQSWAMREMLIEGQGNFGSVEGDPPASMRYTEARLRHLGASLMDDMEKDTVDFVPNYDETREEPTVLPAAWPNLLVNGGTGIAVGMATNIPPHNLSEIIDAICAQIDDPEINIEGLMAHVKGPDFPTGCILLGTKPIKQYFETGKGSLRIRGKAGVEEMKGGKEQIVITEIPYYVNRANLVIQIADLVRELGLPVEVDFLEASSYGDSMRSSREVRILKDIRGEVAGRDVLVVEDIVDTGFTLHHVRKVLEAREPRRLCVCALLDKPSRREVDVKATWTGFEIPDEFVVGYGIDYAQRNRNLPYIGKVRFTE